MAKARKIEIARPSGKRCAIYTRKSTEEGLDQEFNSLDAQREACASYIASQRHEGWVLVPDLYDDGGFSGGNMERPGLKQLLAEVKAGRVDVIVVYKVDRLTRALSDFAKIVDVLDAAGASFVSITQSFNTTTSMGRLTLNVLLSFAQFEREVISERVRDKIAASKRKGMWMGGNVPLGYDVHERKLVVNEGEAAIVSRIFQRYLDLGSVPALLAELARDGVRTKVQGDPQAGTRGDKQITRGGLYHILSNRIYRGEIMHRDVANPGQHEPLIDQDLWDRVRSQLAANGVERRIGTNADQPSILAGMIRDQHGRRMTPSHATRGSRRYRYYVSVDDAEGKSVTRTTRLAAGSIEQLITDGVMALLRDETALIASIGAAALSASQTSITTTSAGTLLASIQTLPPSAVRALFIELDLGIIVQDDGVSASVDAAQLARRLGLPDCLIIALVKGGRCMLPTATIAPRPTRGPRLAIVPKTGGPPSQRDANLIALLLRARDAQRQLMRIDGVQRHPTASYSALHAARLARLSFLAPDIVTAILEGRQPPALNARWLSRISAVPLCWKEQRRTLGLN